jgi:hypothetical protein
MSGNHSASLICALYPEMSWRRQVNAVKLLELKAILTTVNCRLGIKSHRAQFNKV